MVDGEDGEKVWELDSRFVFLFFWLRYGDSFFTTKTQNRTEVDEMPNLEYADSHPFLRHILYVF